MLIVFLEYLSFWFFMGGLVTGLVGIALMIDLWWRDR